MSESPRSRARRILRYLKLARYQGDDDRLDFIAEVIADAQNEVREGFLRKPTRNEGKVHK